MAQCTFHPNEIAVAKCERCSRLICVMDKKIHRIRRSSGTGSSSSSYSERYEFCPICYYDNQINSLIGRKVMFFIIPFLSIFIIIPLVMIIGFISKATNDPYYLGPPLIFIIPFMLIFILVPSAMIFVLMRAYKQAPAKAEQMRQDKQEFINSLDIVPKGIELTSSPNKDHKWTNTNLFCFQCGGEIDLKQSFCPSCGDSTADEKEFLNN